MFKRALEAAAFALYKADGGEAGGTEPRQRRADAAGLMAERALETGLGGGDMGDDVADDAEASPAQSGSDAKSDTRSGARSKTRSGARAEHCQVVLHTEMATLREDGEPGRSDLDGVRVSAETSRRIACDASVVPMTHAPDGSVLSVGRKRRTIPPHLRRALEERDRGCRYPGCDHRFTDAHHVKHWADGGETRLDNLLLLCASTTGMCTRDGCACALTLAARRRSSCRTGGRWRAAHRRWLPAPDRWPPPPSERLGRGLHNGAHWPPYGAVPWELKAEVNEALEADAAAAESAAAEGAGERTPAPRDAS